VKDVEGGSYGRPNTIQYNTIQYNTIHTIQYNILVPLRDVVAGIENGTKLYKCNLRFSSPRFEQQNSTKYKSQPLAPEPQKLLMCSFYELQFTY